VVCSVNRPAILHDTVISIVAQDHPISEILIVCPSKRHILQETLETPKVRFVLGPLGLPAQRNAGLETIDTDSDLVAFFDDDIELCTSYLKNIAALFAENPDIRIASGKLLYDGGRSTVVTREQARMLCEEHERTETQPPAPVSYVPSNSAYGCNMIVRHAAINKLRFDEGLPLYAWLEDRDYSHRITKNLHPPVECQDAVAVHLGARSGRIGGVRMGFSEIINPVYLWTKNKTFSLPYIVVQYWMRCLLGNILGILTRDSDYDRVGLLKGNLLGLQHLLCGRCDPSYIIKLKPNPTSSDRQDDERPSAATITSIAS
jgi:GT2 family glycosyltransferase